MKLNFDQTTAIPKHIGTSIVFWEYPNKSLLVEVDGHYSVIAYSNGDSIYLCHDDTNQYRVWKIYTADGLKFLFQEGSYGR